LNDDLGGKLSVPLPPLGVLNSTISVGLDYKHYQAVSYNTNNFFAVTSITNSDGSTSKISTTTSSGQNPLFTTLDYLPLNVGLNGSVPDAWGTTFFNAQANFNLAVLNGYVKSGTNITHGGFSKAAYSTNAQNNYVTVQMGADRVQTIYQDWTVKLHADGQWANTPLFSNEQYAMGGMASVRGYQNGEAYGDTGWRATIEPQTPQVSIGMAGNDGSEVPVWVRGSVFTDYGEIYRIDSFSNGARNLNYWGAGFGVTASIGNHLDARLMVAWPLISQSLADAGSIHVYFALGAQF